MRVLHLVGRSQGRGAELVALELARELDARGHHNEVVACNPAFDRSQHPDLAPLTNRVRMGPIALLEGVLRLRRFLARRDFDVLLAHGGWAVAVGAFGRPRHGPLLVWQRILGFPPAFWRAPRKQGWRRVATRVDAAIALTPEMDDEMRRLGFDRPVWVIPNFRRTQRFTAIDRASASKQLRHEIGVDAHVALVGMVGHLIEQKRPERAVAVLRGITAAGLDVELVVAGDGPRRDAVVRAAAGAGLAGKVHMLGHRHEVEQILGGIDLLLLTSDHEGIPGVVIEAMMSGCPVVTFPFAAASALVADAGAGVVLEAPDTDAMIAVVTTLLRDRDERLAMGDHGRANADTYSIERAASRYEAHLGELVRRRGQ